MGIFKIKRLCHIFVNNIFYFIVFLIGFFIGLFGKQFFKLENVFADEIPITEFVTQDYDFLPVAFETGGYIKKFERIKKYFCDNYDCDVYGITLGAYFSYGDSEHSTINNSRYSTDNSNLFVIVYKKDEFNFEWLKISGSYSSSYFSYITFNFISNTHYSYYTTSFTSGGLFTTTSLDDFDNWIENNLASKFLELKTLKTGSGYFAPTFSPDIYNGDIFVYYSDLDIIFHENNRKYKVNGLVIEDGEVWPTYIDWQKNKSPSVLDNLTYVCSDKPFLLSEKMNSLSDHKNTETFDSKIYFDYDIPYDLYSFLFKFYNFNYLTLNKTEIEGHVNYLEKIDTLWNLKIDFSNFSSDDTLYTVPFTINTTENNPSHFLGISKLWEIIVETSEDGTKTIKWDTLPNLQNWNIDTNSRYFYFYLINRGKISSDMSYEKYQKSQNSCKHFCLVGVPIDWEKSLTVKADYIKYLLVERLDRAFPNNVCFYYDSKNLTFSFAPFDENGNPTGTMIHRNKLTDVTIDLNSNIWLNDGRFVINENLRGPISYLSKLVNNVWNAFPTGLKVIFLSIFSITLIFMFLRMVGYYG